MKTLTVFDVVDFRHYVHSGQSVAVKVEDFAHCVSCTCHPTLKRTGVVKRTSGEWTVYSEGFGIFPIRDHDANAFQDVVSVTIYDPKPITNPGAVIQVMENSGSRYYVSHGDGWYSNPAKVGDVEWNEIHGDIRILSYGVRHEDLTDQEVPF